LRPYNLARDKAIRGDADLGGHDLRAQAVIGETHQHRSSWACWAPGRRPRSISPLLRRAATDHHVLGELLAGEMIPRAVPLATSTSSRAFRPPRFAGVRPLWQRSGPSDERNERCGTAGRSAARRRAGRWQARHCRTIRRPAAKVPEVEEHQSIRGRGDACRIDGPRGACNRCARAP
jgi:hypothetical protein